MKKKSLILAAALSLAVGSGFAQRTPTHPFDFKDPGMSTGASLFEVFDTWEAGTPLPGSDEFEDEFYISRVRPLSRFTDSESQVYPTMDPNRKMCMWVPCADPSVKWQALPRYSFEGDNFGLWSYVDIHGNWAAPWFRVSAGLMDAAHKNGVKVGCVATVAWAANAKEGTKWGNLFTKLIEKNEDGTFKNVKKFVALMKYYGIDRIGLNSEFNTSFDIMDAMQNFFAECYTEAEAINWHFGVDWYNLMDDGGGCGCPNYLTDEGYNSNICNFQKDGKKVTDMFFLNYGSRGTNMQRSEDMCKKYKRDSYDVYAGMDIQGRALKNSSWTALKDHKISIGLWGAHAQSIIHQGSNDLGSSDYAIQNTYAKKQELIFSGGNANPAKHPEIGMGTQMGLDALKNFHGIASFISARSTLQELPFITRFSLGNGLKRYQEGKVTFDHKWYNMGSQDFLPTWRWWITDSQNEVTSSLIKASINFDDAFTGGNSIKFSGATTASRVRLFKTKFNIKASNKFSVTYKALNTASGKAKIFVSKQGDALTPIEIELPEGTKGEWKTYETSLSAFGLHDGDVISVLGLSFENTASDYEFLLGEMKLTDATQTFTPVQPEIRKIDILRGRYNAVDFKLFYKSKDESNGVKTYNDEVDTWYFEVYTQQEGSTPVLVTTTPSWGAYVIDAPCSPQDLNTRYGVCAVAPDGTRSAMTWTEYIERPIEPVETVLIDRAVIKPNEDFTIKFEDVLHENVDWSVVDPLTNETLASKNATISLTTSINKVGLYDLVITKGDKKVITRGFVQITPETTGSVPAITSVEANKTEASVDETIDITFAAKKGEGTVSRALRISDPNKFKLPGEIQIGYPYSYALWFKADKWAHDKQGTNLINKLDYKDPWPHNNWGDLWVAIRPEWNGSTKKPSEVLHPANEISFNIYKYPKRDSPNEKMMTTGYSITPGVWNHLVVSSTETEQWIYLNGKMVAHQTDYNSMVINGYACKALRRSEGPVYIGGPNVYKAGFQGYIDDLQVWSKALTPEEVLASMKGYTTAPEHLDGYFDFEELNADGTFNNKGHLSNLKGELVVAKKSSGESTAGTYDERVTPNNNALGYPGLPGTLPITTEVKWQLEGAKTTTDIENGKSVSYDVDGTFTVGLTLSNMWGEDTLLKNEYLVIGNGDGVEDIEDHKVAFSVYPNPFVEEVNLFFEHEGTYKIVISTMEGMQLSTKKLHVKAQEVVSMQVNGRAGMYLVQVYSSSNKVVKAFKVIKK